MPHLFSSRDLVLREDASEWDVVSSSVGVTRDRLLLIKQVHGVEVALARRGTASWSRPQADSVVTDDPAVAIGVRTADCAPILLFDPVRHVAGAIHAGWRGTAAGAAGSGVAAMVKEFGTRPADLIAAIGPCLSACCGEVGPDVLDAFRAGGADASSLSAWFTPGTADRSFLDLDGANRDQLVRAGLDPAAIHVSGLCTRTHHERFHSYRAAREHAGRLLAAIRVPAS